MRDDQPATVRAIRCGIRPSRSASRAGSGMRWRSLTEPSVPTWPCGGRGRCWPSARQRVAVGADVDPGGTSIDGSYSCGSRPAPRRARRRARRLGDRAAAVEGAEVGDEGVRAVEQAHLHLLVGPTSSVNTAPPRLPGGPSAGEAVFDRPHRERLGGHGDLVAPSSAPTRRGPLGGRRARCGRPCERERDVVEDEGQRVRRRGSSPAGTRGRASRCDVSVGRRGCRTTARSSGRRPAARACRPRAS